MDPTHIHSTIEHILAFLTLAGVDNPSIRDTE